jgi:nitroreductase
MDGKCRQPMQIDQISSDHRLDWAKTVFKKLFKVSQFFVEYASDMWQFVRFNGYSPLVRREKRLFYKIIIETHTIEKGLSLQNRRHFFGQEKIRFLMNALDKYDATFSPFPVEMAVGALSAYLEFHRDISTNDKILGEIRSFLSARRTSALTISAGGVREFPLAVSRNSDSRGASTLLVSRASLRMFDPAPIDSSVIGDLITVAQRAPSQCNRQSSRVHLYQDQSTIQALLALQGGSRGFSDSVGNLFVVSSDIAAWGGPGQRNQPYVDGSLFAMSILLACHSYGLATCPLNLAVTNSVERKIREVGGIPAGERLVMMIAFGNSVSGPLRVAASPRRQLEEVLSFH